MADYSETRTSEILEAAIARKIPGQPMPIEAQIIALTVFKVGLVRRFPGCLENGSGMSRKEKDFLESFDNLTSMIAPHLYSPKNIETFIKIQDNVFRDFQDIRKNG